MIRLNRKKVPFLDNERVTFTTPNKSLLPYISEYIYSIPNNPASICNLETSQHRVFVSTDILKLCDPYELGSIILNLKKNSPSMVFVER